MVRVTVMMPVTLVQWLDLVRGPAHGSRSMQVRLIVADAKRKAERDD